MQKEQILHAATEQFLRLGVKSVSMDDISSLLGISKKTLYQYVSNKEELIKETMHSFSHIEQQLVEDISKNANDALDEMIQLGRHHVSVVRNMSPSMTFDLKKYYPQVWKIVKEFNDNVMGKTIVKNIDKGIAEGLYRDDLNSKIVSKLFRIKSWAIVDRIHFPIEEFRQDELIREHLLYHLNGILSDKGRERIKTYELF